MRFYLGAHELHWLRISTVPLFVSHRRLQRTKAHWKYRANVDWCIDSGGFTELNLNGRWTTSPQEYVSAVRTYCEDIGRVVWAAPQDAMCEPWILEKSKSWLGGTVEAHQMYTIDNFIELRTLAPDLPFIPTLQGWVMEDYLNHCEMYAAAGIDLTKFDTVGLGSVCRRESTDQISNIVMTLASRGMNLHGFGMKTLGVTKCGNYLTSSDSMAWSYSARMHGPRPCPHGGKAKCCNCCYPYAIEWRTNLLEKAKAQGVRIQDF